MPHAGRSTGNPQAPVGLDNTGRTDAQSQRMGCRSGDKWRRPARAETWDQAGLRAQWQERHFCVVVAQPSQPPSAPCPLDTAPYPAPQTRDTAFAVRRQAGPILLEDGDQGPSWTCSDASLRFSDGHSSHKKGTPTWASLVWTQAHPPRVERVARGVVQHTASRLGCIALWLDATSVRRPPVVQQKAPSRVSASPPRLAEWSTWVAW
mmetsp:Transcript_46140/g.108734  ORF Transcript_46140/g.108734 Transcript_46140/m.108734 type:complete len:207 (-) Transcript_46140:436-1056(-)